jgi:excinuclease UvrABC nuclease subunit
VAGSKHVTLYRVYGDEGILLYIGVSNNFGRRWNEHSRNQPWWNSRRRMTVDWYNTEDEALDAEAHAIFNEQPRYNVMHRKQAQRLKSLQVTRSPCPAYATVSGEDLFYLDDPAYRELIQSMQRAAQEREARRIAGRLTGAERRDYELMASLNSGPGDSDLT